MNHPPAINPSPSRRRLANDGSSSPDLRTHWFSMDHIAGPSLAEFFDRQFAESLFTRARRRLREERTTRGKLALCEALGPEAGQGVPAFQPLNKSLHCSSN